MKMLYVVQMKDGNRVFTFAEDDDKDFKIGFETNNKTFITSVSANGSVREANQIEQYAIREAFKKWYNEE